MPALRLVELEPEVAEAADDVVGAVAEVVAVGGVADVGEAGEEALEGDAALHAREGAPMQ